MSLSHNHKYTNPDRNEPWDLLIGEISAPQGLKGEVRVYPHTDFPERFSELQEIGLRKNGQWMGTRAITAARVTGRRIVLKIAGIDSREDAEAMRGVQLLIPKSWAVELGEDEFYYHQLLGMEVVTTTGKSLGQITDIWPTGANDVYETPLALIPATKDMIRDIDIEHGRMTVEDRPGLRKDEAGE
jgi:16S rRNA processing protein RimM